MSNFIVVRLGNSPQNPPRVIHGNEEAARKEAARLAEKHPGCCFVVADIVTAYSTKPNATELSIGQMPLLVKVLENEQ